MLVVFATSVSSTLETRSVLRSGPPPMKKCGAGWKMIGAKTSRATV